MMSEKLREAAQAALDWLKDEKLNCHTYIDDIQFDKDREKQAKDLEAALAKPDVQEFLTVAEPIAWLVTYGNFTHVEYTKPNMVVDTYYQPLYTSPLAEQKPMLEMNPEKREWVGLTDEEVTEIRLKMFDVVATNYEAYRAIEAKLREKNT